MAVYSFVFYVFAVAVILGNAEVPTKEGSVHVLTESNFEDFIKSEEFVLVKFYAPWCGHCKAIAPEFAKAAEKLESEGSQIKLGKVDATVESKLAETYEVQGYPTLKFFKSGKPFEYNGGRTADTIHSWVSKKSGPPIKLVSSEDFETMLTANKVIVAVFSKDDSSDDFKVATAVANEMEVPFVHLADAAAFTKYDVSKSFHLALFKQFDDKRNDYDGPLKETEITSFIEENQIPLVVEFDQESAQAVFASPIKKHFLAFMSKAADYYQSNYKLVEDAAKKFKGKMHYLVLDVDVPDHSRILEFFGMKKEEVPSYRVVELGDSVTKYKPETDAYTEIETFASGVLAGTVEPFYESQDIPEDWDKLPLKVLVAKNFKEVALDSSKAAFVLFYAPWCGHCKEIMPTWTKLAESYKDRSDIVIAKLDSTANEMKGINIGSFPTLKYFAKDTNKVVDYTGERNLDGFKSFIESGGTVKQSGGDDAEELEDDEDKKHDEL